MTAATFPALLQRFFTERLCTQMNASSNTIAGYRDTFRLLLRYAQKQYGRPPTRLRIDDLDVDLIAAFLTYIEAERGNSARSRNTRLAAIRSFFRFVAMNEPAYLLHCQRILGVAHTLSVTEHTGTARLHVLACCAKLRSLHRCAHSRHAFHMGQEREPRAGDALVDRYFPDADDETRERAREAFRDFALFIFRMGERIVNERDAQASSPKPDEGAILSEAPREPPV